MDTAKLFKIILVAGIVIAVFANLSALFDIVRLSEEQLVTSSYFWIFLIVYGIVGLTTYKHALEQNKSAHTIPAIVATTSIFMLIFFFVAVFPSL